MKFNPYAVLGIDKNATTAEIKDAYKRRARETHPDVSGASSSEEFKRVVDAYKVLADPEAKQNFDETGNVDAKSVEKNRKGAQEFIALSFENLLKSSINSKEKITTINFVREIKVSATNNIAHAQQMISVLEMRADEIQELKRNITRRSKGKNLFADALTRQEELIQSRLDDEQTRLQVLEFTLVELNNYDNVVEMVNAFQFYSDGGPYSSSTSVFFTRGS